MQSTPLTPQQLEDDLSGFPMPAAVPNAFPGTPFPVELPVINPSPGANPFPQPLRVPQGDPQPIPNTDPAQWKTPVIDIVPSPTPAEPWRVDVQPKDIIKTDATPLPDSDPVPVTPPEGQTEQEVTPDLCEKNPEILACQKLDEPDSENVEKLDKTVTVSPDSGWGAGNAACPAARHITVQGRDVPIPFDLFCTYMSGIRPLVISMAWLSAGFILLGVKGGD